jgi:hypothetical protein
MRFSARSGPEGQSRVRRLGILLAGCMALAAAAATPASAAITPTNNANALAAALAAGDAGPGVGFTGASLDVSPNTPPFPNGVENAPLAGFPTNGGLFTILTTGDVSLADQPNSSESSGANLGYNPPARGDANDPTTLGVSFNVPGNDNCLNLDYKFFSEEFPEFVGTTFNDRFIAELDGSNWAAAGQTSTAPLDFAARGTQISINSIGPTAVSPTNAAGTTYDAASALVTTKTPVTPGGHTLYLSIFDASDHIYDSAVFVDNLRFTNEPKIKCHPPDIFGGKVGVDLPSSAKVKGGKALIPVTCLLPPGVTINCEGNVTLLAAPGSLARTSSLARKAKIGKKKYSIPPGQTKKIKVRLKKKAKKAVARKHKLKVKVKVFNSANGAKKTFKLKLKK